MKAKRWISLLLAVSMMLGVLAMPAAAAAQQPESTAAVSEELPDAARLEKARHQEEIAAGVNRVSQSVAIADLGPHGTGEGGSEDPCFLLELVFPAAEDHDLPAAADDLGDEG